MYITSQTELYKLRYRSCIWLTACLYVLLFVHMFYLINGLVNFD